MPPINSSLLVLLHPLVHPSMSSIPSELFCPLSSERELGKKPIISALSIVSVSDRSAPIFYVSLIAAAMGL